MAANPSGWQGPSFLVSVTDGNSAMCAMGGYRRELAAWEGRLPGGRQLNMKWREAATTVFGDATHMGRNFQQWRSFELEVILDDITPEILTDLIKFCCGPEVADSYQTLPEIGSVPISSNQDLSVPPSWRAIGISAVDLRFSTIPTRRWKHGAEVVFGSRWVRLIVLPHGHVTLWHRIQGNWPANAVRWPHNCIPSRDAIRLNEMAHRADLNGEDRILSFLTDCFIHEEYFIRSWMLELELWEERLFGQLVETHSDVFGGLRFPELQKELGHLADYLALVRFDQRNVGRRADESRALSGRLVKSLLATRSVELEALISQNRVLLREAFRSLSNAATGEQLYTAREQQQSSERLQNTITFVSVTLLVPALIAAIYGANVNELTPGATGRITSLLGAMAAGALISTLGLRAVQGQELVPGGAKVGISMAAIGMAGTTSTGIWLLTGGPSTLPAVLLISSLLVLIYSLLWIFRMRTRRTKG
jgi:hypothetical protein